VLMERLALVLLFLLIFLSPVLYDLLGQAR
jgi:hypothetical protein